MKVAPSLIAADFTQLKKEIQHVEQAGADMLHLDVMDGVFVPNLTFGPMIVQAISALASVEIEAHLMIVEPERYLKQFIDAGADWISVHTEATDKASECIDFIHGRQVKAGLALNPPTKFKQVQPYIENLDYLMVMSVNPGFYGQKFIDTVLEKIEEIKNWIVTHNLTCVIIVDGGINNTNACRVCDAGADVVVAGAGVFKADDYRAAIEQLRCSKD